MNTFNPVLIRVIREVLTPGIHRFAPRMSAEVGRLLPERLPDTTTPGSPEWAEIKPLDVIMPIVSIAAGSILVGPDLCRRREWIDTSIGWAHAVFRAGVNLKQWPWYLRPFVYKFIPEMRGLQAMRRMVADMVDPVVEQRAREAAKVGPAEWEKRKPDDFVQWYTDNRGDFPEPLGSAILGVGMVSINSTSNATVNACVFFPKWSILKSEEDSLLTMVCVPVCTTWLRGPSIRSRSARRSWPRWRPTTAF